MKPTFKICCALALIAATAASFGASINFTSTGGKRVRPALHGCGVAPRVGTVGKCNETQVLKDANFYSSRTHDWLMHDGAEAIVDLPQIFPFMDKDPDDPASYRFGPTDVALAACTNAGMRVFYRLGLCGPNAGDDKGAEAYHLIVNSTTQFDKVAKIFSRIIAHYNEGWANGFHMGIDYWEIWNEPGADPGVRWSSSLTAADFATLFAKCVKQIKTDHPTVKVGGPANCYKKTDFLGNCLTACNNLGVRPDFYTYHLYSNQGGSSEPNSIVASASDVRSFLNGRTCAGQNCGDMEIGLTEWNYESGSESGTWSGRLTMDGASWCTAFAMNMQYSELDFAHWYGSGVNASYGIYDGRNGKLTKIYQALKMVGMITKDYTKLASRSDTTNLYVLGAVNETGTKGCIMVSDRNNSSGTTSVTLTFPSGKTLSNVKCYVTDGTRDAEETTCTLSTSSLSLTRTGRSVWLVTFDIN